MNVEKNLEGVVNMSHSTLKEIVDEKFESMGNQTGSIDYPRIKEPKLRESVEKSNIDLTDYDTIFRILYSNFASTKLTSDPKLKQFSRKKILLKTFQSLIRNYKINPIKKGFKLFLDFLNFNKIYSKEYLKVELINELRDSIEILNLGDNWDGEGSQGYQKKTWKKMVNFLQEMAFKYFIDTNLYLNSPLVYPGSKGDLDVHWKTKEFELFLSIPQSDDDPIIYYGDDYKKNVIEGSFEKDNFEEILSWLKKFP